MRNTLLFSAFQFKLIIRDFKLTLLGFLMPVFMFYIFSNLFKGQNFGPANINIVDYLIPAFIPIIIINSVMLIFGQYYIMYREQDTLLKYKLLGMKNHQLTLAIFIPSFILQIMAIILLIFTGVIFQNITVPIGNLYNVFLAILIINFFEYSLTNLLLSFISNSTSYQSISVLLFNYQMFVGGLTFPPELFPKSFQFVLEYLNPIYYGLIIMRNVWTKEENIINFPKEIIILLLFSIVFLLISHFISNRKSKHN